MFRRSNAWKVQELTQSVEEAQARFQLLEDGRRVQVSLLIVAQWRVRKGAVTLRITNMEVDGTTCF